MTLKQFEQLQKQLSHHATISIQLASESMAHA